jgi:hypothetical protein
MRKWIAALGLVLIATLLGAQTETLSGTVENPDGTPFNGSFVISLALGRVSNTCSFAAVTSRVTVNVVGGVFPATALLPTPCLSPSIPYFVSVSDSFKRPVYADNWYIPQTLGATVDVGTMGDVKLASGITVAVPLAIISTPAGNQTITQPGSTALSINNLTVTGIFIASGTLSASITGNAATATYATTAGTAGALMNTPSQCPTSPEQEYSTGIDVGGNANCQQIQYSQISGTPGTAIYYQTLQGNGIAETQRAAANFSSRFALSDSSSPAQTNIDLATSGVSAGAYTLANITVDAYGRVTAASGSSFTSGSNANGWWVKDPTGTITQRGYVADMGSGDYTITFPTAFTTTTGLIVNDTTVNSTTGSWVNITPGTLSTTQVTFHQDNGYNLAMMWIAVGN